MYVIGISTSLLTYWSTVTTLADVSVRPATQQAQTPCQPDQIEVPSLFNFKRRTEDMYENLWEDVLYYQQTSAVK